MPRLLAPFPGKSVIYCTVGWRDIEKKIFDTFQVVPNCSRTPIPKFHTLMLLIHLTFDNFACYPKKSKTKYFSKRFWSLRQGGMYSLICLNLKEMRNSKFNSKTVLTIFGKKKKLKFKNFEFSFWRLIFDVKGRLLQFFKTNIHF